eukprot:Phypoly_transcript_01912.p1 GENE.Phypoly_transcript_01912~~Phypoly_transcript_01912.p1  ORF type:complete len:725 (-),score=69.41 Phypoly_transcript_01912:359-2533(-)
MLLRDGVVNQNYLEKVVRVLHPNENIHINNLNEIKNPTTGNQLEVDVWVPSLQLCFEFQDIYHYSSVFYSHNTLQAIQTRDCLKNEQLRRRNETAVIVPHWWIGDRESLQATIQFMRPDMEDASSLFQHPISLNPLLIHEGNTDAVPNIGELMLASFPDNLILPNICGPSWWIGEKYDGIRFCWHPVEKIVYSRRGVPLVVPTNVTRDFGSSFMDGEFWSGRGSYQEAARLIHPQPYLNEALSRFIAFDIPSSEFHDEPYETRYGILIARISLCHPMLIVPGRMVCSSTQVLENQLLKILDFGGEGIILCKFYAPYKSGRSNFQYKLKTANAMEIDEEVLVVLTDHDRVTLQLPNGETFLVPRTSATALVRPGDVVTVSSTGHTHRHLPINPSITRVCEDSTWEQVVSKSGHIENAKRKSLNTKDARSFFEKFAKLRNFDPLVASNWYPVSSKHVKMIPEGKSLLRKHNFNVVSALIAAFPQIGLEKDKFADTPKNFWSKTQNQRRYIMKLAKQSGFDPLNTKEWNKLYPIIAQKLSRHTIAKHYGSVSKALVHLFPDISLKNQLFIKQVTNGTTRLKLIALAKSKGFDPLIAENWYNFKFRKYESTPEIRSLLSYKHGWISAVREAFPELRLDPSQFRHNKFIHKDYWADELNQRNFFVQFAKKRGFDPLIAQNWYKISSSQIKSSKRGRKILEHYAGNYQAALFALFPNSELFQMYRRLNNT